jgi:hypothetical protein
MIKIKINKLLNENQQPVGDDQQTRALLNTNLQKNRSMYPYANPKGIDFIINNVQPLQNNKIVKFLGGGLYGIAFQLSNDHVLKLFVDSFSGKDQAYYSAYKNALFSKKGSPYLPTIYTTGTVMFYNIPLSYVEMNKVIPFEEWLKKTGRGGKIKAADQICSNLIMIMYDIEDLETLTGKKITNFKQIKQYFGNKQPSIQQIVGKIRLSLRSAYIQKIFTKEEIMGIMKAAIEMRKLGIPLHDLHTGNFGVDPVSQAIVIYDN